ncbi:hypothetical protein K457DRAFT_484004 [Linnemannia elongata AG-77]|uniref:SH3 domain-containing protein n=1 Tax=Linnemannia elongata AG-77 TaxID=1314771 RepID=A0A197JZ58_9FUNG|nr:hypothetical protein K457DRAFT_484004 [Linnemannia elongata AG-77]
MIPTGSHQNQHHRPRLPNSSSSGGSIGSNGSTGSTSGMAPANNPVAFYNIHQPSARSPLSQETTPFGLFRHKNLSTSALPSGQSQTTVSSSNLVLAPVTTASTMSFSPSSSYTNLAETNLGHPRTIDPTSRPTANYSPSERVLPPLPPLAKVPTNPSPKPNGRPASFQYIAQFYAWWDYIARDHDELSFKKGDILLVSREFDDLWCMGSVMKPDKRTSARHGFFPLQYCSLESQCYVPTTRVSLRSGGTPGAEPGGRLTIVLPFHASNQDEMSLRPGNQVRSIHFFDDGWVLGEQIDHAGTAVAIGAFPAAIAKPVTAAGLDAVVASSAGGAGGPGPGPTTLSSPSKLRHVNVGSPLVPTQDIGLSKGARQREESGSSTSTFNTLYSQPNSSAHLLQHYAHNGSISSTNSLASTIKPPGSPTASPYNPSQQSYRASPTLVPIRSPHAGMEVSRSGASPNPNRASVQSTTSSNGGRSILNHANAPTITEDQVIRALQERPAQDRILQVYLAQGGDPNIVDGNGNSLLHLAIIAHSQASVVFLVNAPDIRLEHGSPISPLYTAVRFRSWKAAQQLIIQGADVNAHDERGVSVLHVVLLFMTKGDTLAEEVVQLLCDNKADVNCVANDKKSIPLLIAVERELWAEVEILMAFGANPYMIWGRDRRQSMGLGQLEGQGANGILTTGYFNDPLWEAVNDDKVHLVRLLLKFYYAPTSFSATSSSPSPSPSSTQSSQSFFGPQHPFVHHSSASSYTTNNGSSGNINIPSLPHGGSVPMPFANNGGHGTPPSIPSPCSAQSSPGSAALHGYMGHRNNAADTVGSPKLTAIQGGSGHVGSFTNASANANMIGGANPIYVITPKVLLQALTLAKDLGHHDCLQILSRPEVTLKEGTLYGTGSFGYNNQLNGQLNGPIGVYGHGHNGMGSGGHGMGKEHRNILQKFTSLFK